MLETEEQVKEYIEGGKQLTAYFMTGIGHFLLQERLKRHQSLEEVAIAVDWTPKRLENMELGKRRMNWYRLAQLLKYYGKELNFSLTDRANN